jgi:arylsulfatase A
MKHIFLLILSLSLGILSDLTGKEQPNILLIMADDLGAENLASYGNTIYQTTNLDRLAAEGARFENAFSTPVCTPTRAMILTGLYPNRTGFLERLDSPNDSEKKNRLPVHIKTFGHVFQEAGYKTAIAGKWHLGDFQTYPDQPTSHGFDEHCLWVQYWDGERPSRYYGPHNWENAKHVVHGKEVFGPDYYADFLIDFMERNNEQPFLAYFPMNLIHGPLINPPGLKELAESKYPDDLGKNESIAGHMVTYMDGIVGRLLVKLEELGIRENTLVIFTGDNGTGGNLVSQLGDFHLRGGKRTMNEAGTRVPFIAHWPKHIPAGKRTQFITLMDVLPTMASIAGITLDHKIDGMDLSHNLYGVPGIDRDFFNMAFEGDCYFVRNDRFRLHEDGRFYGVSVTSNEARYSMDVIDDRNEHQNVRAYLQNKLNIYTRIQQTDTSYTVVPFGTNGDNFKNAQETATSSSK